MMDISSMYFQFAGAVILLILIIIYFVKPHFKSIETKIYSILLTCTFISLILDFISTYNAINQNFGIILFLSSKLYLFFTVNISSIFLIYLMYVTFKIDENNSNIKFLKKLLISFLIGSSLILLCLPLYNFSEPPIIYTYGPMVTFSAVHQMIVFTCMILIIIFNRKRAINQKIVPVISLILLSGVGSIFQLINPEYLILSFSCVVVILIMYLTMENPDVKMVKLLEEAKKEAERANKAKTDFLSSMSHEIRTPLNAIVGFSEFIKTENDLESAKKDADDILMASQNLLEIVNGILDISKIEADKMEIVNTEYYLKEHIDNIIKMINPRIKDKPINLNYNFSEDIPDKLYGDVGKIKQIITNIMTNAAKYTEEGSIDLSIKCVNNPTYTTLVILVKDTGRGIKNEQIDKLFTKFNRLDEDKNTTLEGTGLGLAITKKFVDMLGGKIVVQSEYGSGSSFVVYINQRIVKLKEEQRHSSSIISSIIKYPNNKVLIVDDNLLNLKVAEKLLSKYDIATEVCDSGDKCLDLIKSGKKYDLIFMDDMMPGKRGSEVLTDLKNINGFTTPVVILTANTMNGDDNQYINQGFSGYLGKPIEKTLLEKILLQFLTRTTVIAKHQIKSKILIVDDNALNIKIASKLLSDFNVEVDSVLSGDKCLDLIKSGKKYDLIFMDIMMPKMTGVDTFYNLKTINGFNTPVVVLTADAVSGSREKYLSMGFNDYITKPLDKKILSSIINKYLSK